MHCRREGPYYQLFGTSSWEIMRLWATQNGDLDSRSKPFPYSSPIFTRAEKRASRSANNEGLLAGWWVQGLRRKYGPEVAWSGWIKFENDCNDVEWNVRSAAWALCHAWRDLTWLIVYSRWCSRGAKYYGSRQPQGTYVGLTFCSLH